MIEMQTTTAFVITLNLAEALAVARDPVPLQQELRALLDALDKPLARPARVNHPVRAGRDGRAPVQRKAPASGLPKTRKRPPKVPCPECGQPISTSQLGTHRKKKHGVVPAAA